MPALYLAEPSTAAEAEPPKRGDQVEAIFLPTRGTEEELARAAYLASLADPSRTGKLLGLAASKKIGPMRVPAGIELISASPVNDLSGVNLGNDMIREGTLESIEKWIKKFGGHIHGQVHKIVSQTMLGGDRAIVIASEKIVLGVVLLKVIKTL